MFQSILVVSEVLGKYRYPRWPLFGNQNVIPREFASSLSVVDLKGNIFERATYPLSIIVTALKGKNHGGFDIFC